MKSEIANPVRRKAFIITIMLATAAVIAAASTARAQEVIAFVNGHPITALDVEQRSKFIQLTSKKKPALQDVLNSLIDEILEVNEAKRFKINVSDAQVDKAFATVARRMGLDVPKLVQILAHDGTSAETLKRRLRAQIAWSSLVRGRYRASLEIADSDVEAQLALHKSDGKDNVGYEYVMRPVIFIVPSGSPPAAVEARKRQAEALRARFQNCTDGIAFAHALDAVAVRDQVAKFSADLPEALRKILDGTAVGHLTPPETTTNGIQMFAICEKRETKSNTPKMQAVREQIFQQKFGAQAKRYLETLRRQAMIEYRTPNSQ